MATENTEKKYLDSAGLVALVGKIKAGIGTAIDNIPKATTKIYGLTQLSSAVNSSAEDLAATPKAVKAAYDLAASKASTNPATTTKAGLMSAEDKAKLDGIDKAKLDGIEEGAQVNTVTSVAGKTGTITLSKSDVGLGNVNNTSDKDKPISTATQAALDTKAARSDLNAAVGRISTAEDKITTLETAVDALSSATDFIGVTTTKLTDGITSNKIVLKNGKNYDAVKGDIVIGDGTNKEFIYDGEKWLELGDTTALASSVAALEEVVGTLEGAVATTPLSAKEVEDIFDEEWAKTN